MVLISSFGNIFFYWKKENQFFTSNNNCPTCRQIIDESFKQSIIDTNSAKIAELEIGNTKLQEELNLLQNRMIKISSIENLIANNNVEINKINSSVSSSKKYMP